MIFRPTLRFLTRPRPPADFAARRLAAVILPPLLFFAIVKSPSLLSAFLLQGRLQLDGEWFTGLSAGIVRRDGKRRTAYGVRARWRNRSTGMTCRQTAAIDPGVPRDQRPQRRADHLQDLDRQRAGEPVAVGGRPGHERGDGAVEAIADEEDDRRRAVDGSVLEHHPVPPDHAVPVVAGAGLGADREGRAV